MIIILLIGNNVVNRMRRSMLEISFRSVLVIHILSYYFYSIPLILSSNSWIGFGTLVLSILKSWNIPCIFCGGLFWWVCFYYVESSSLISSLLCFKFVKLSRNTPSLNLLNNTCILSLINLVFLLWIWWAFDTFIYARFLDQWYMSFHSSLCWFILISLEFTLHMCLRYLGWFWGT